MAPQTDVVDRLGRPLRDLRISVTDRCNFRCTYCMPAEIFGDAYQFLPRPDILTFETHGAEIDAQRLYPGVEQHGVKISLGHQVAILSG